MPATTQKLISQLLSQPRIRTLQDRLAVLSAGALAAQGLQSKGPSRESRIDTGVGQMRRLSIEMLEPLSGAAMELQVFLLAKVDGSVACWSELWGTQADNDDGSARMARLGNGGGDVVLPRRLRLVRQNHFEGNVGKAWAKQPDPLQLAESRLAELGLFSDAVTAPARAAELARAVTA